MLKSVVPSNDMAASASVVDQRPCRSTLDTARARPTMFFLNEINDLGQNKLVLAIVDSVRFIDSQ